VKLLSERFFGRLTPGRMVGTPLHMDTSLPRTMARIRRLVRENPNDRELQRLLHTLLTSMSSERVDEGEVNSVLAQMEQRKSRQSLEPQKSPPLTGCLNGLRALGDSREGRAVASPLRLVPGQALTPSPGFGTHSATITPAQPRRANCHPFEEDTSGTIARAAAAIATAERQQRAYADEVHTLHGRHGDTSSAFAPLPSLAPAAPAPPASAGASPLTTAPLALTTAPLEPSRSQPTCASLRRLTGTAPTSSACVPTSSACAPISRGSEPSVGPSVGSAVGSPESQSVCAHFASGGGDDGDSGGGGSAELGTAAPEEAASLTLFEPGAALSGGYWSAQRHEQSLEVMRRRQEQALTALRQKSFRDARQAQAQHEYAIAQLRRQSEEQLGAAAEARRAEAKRADGLAQKLGEVQARLRRLEAQQPLAVVGGSSARWSGESVDVKGASAGDVPGLEGELAAELRAMAHSHRIELGAKEKAAAAVLEREVAHRERALASLEAGFAEERAELEGRSTKLGARVKELEAQQQKALEAFKSRAEVAERALEAERSERRALEENFSAAQRQWKAGQAEEAQRRQREDDALVDDVMTRRRQEMLAEARKQARSELWEEARRSAKEELEGARLELEAEMLARRSLYRENEEARAAAEARTEAAEAAASRAKAAAREEGFAEGREAAWREARMIARLEMEEEMKRAGAEQAVAAEVKLRELEQARTQVHLQLAEAERAMSIAVQDAREEAIAQTRAKAYEEAREQVQAEWAGQQGGAQQGWPSAEGAGVGGAGMEPSSPSAPATPEGSHAGGLTGPAPSPGPSPGFGSSRMLDAVSRLAESEQRAWVSEVERTVQQRQMLSKAQEVSQAIGAEMRRAREAIIAEYGPGIFDSAAASGAVADLPTRALGLLAAAAAPAARNADELQLEHSSEVMEELIKAKGKLRQRDEALRERDLELAELRAQLEGLRLKAARAERKAYAHEVQVAMRDQSAAATTTTATAATTTTATAPAAAAATAPASPAVGGFAIAASPSAGPEAARFGYPSLPAPPPAYPEPTPDTEPLDAPLSSGVGEVQSAAPPPAAEDPYGYATTRAAAEAVFADGYAEAEGGASGDAVPGVSDGLAGLGEPPSELPPVPVVKPRLPPPPPQVVAARGEFPAPGFFCAPASDAPYAATAPLTPAAASALAAPPSPPLPEQSPSQKVSDSPPGSSAAPTGSSAAPTGSSAALTGSSAAPSGSSAAPTGSSAAPSGSSAAPKPGSSGPTAATRPAAQKPSPKQSKPDGGLRAAIEAGAWMAEVLGIAPPPEAADVEGHHALLHAWLRSGELLCELINKLQPGTISRVSSSAMPFKQMENISNYIEACAALGVPNQDCFRSVDLFEGKDLRAVVRNIHSLGRVAQRLEGFHGPTLGAKLAEKNERSFTEQQLSEAKAMPARWSNVGKSMPSADAPVQPRPQAAGMRRGP